jgi:hypothetical protein
MMRGKIFISVIIGVFFYASFAHAMEAFRTYDPVKTRQLEDVLSTIVCTKELWPTYKKSARRLIIEGADPNVVGFSYCNATLLSLAVSFEDTEYVQFLFNQGAVLHEPVLPPCQVVESPLFNTSDVIMFKLLLEAKADVAAKKLSGPQAGHTILHVACASEYPPKIVELLCGAMDQKTIEATTVDEDNALHILARYAHDYTEEHCGDVCLKARAIMERLDVNKINGAGQNPLQFLQAESARKQQIEDEQKDFAMGAYLLSLMFQEKVRQRGGKFSAFLRKMS